MMPESKNRFDDFFGDRQYVSLKNYLYNYLLRKRAVERTMRREKKELVLETGSGISPVMTSWERMVYSDVSPSAMAMLKPRMTARAVFVADARDCLSKKSLFSRDLLRVLSTFWTTGGVERDQQVTKTGGGWWQLSSSRCYFAHDRFVHHYRDMSCLK